MDYRFSKDEVDHQLEEDGCYFQKPNVRPSPVALKNPTKQCDSIYYDSGTGFSLPLDSVDGQSRQLSSSYRISDNGAPIAVASTDDCVGHYLLPTSLQSDTYSSNDVSSCHLPEEFSKLQMLDEGFHSHGELSSHAEALSIPCITPEQDNQACLLKERESLLEMFCQDDDGDTQLHMSIIQGLIDFTLYFVSITPVSSCLDIPNNLLQTPLHLAVITNQVYIVRRLMTGGADVDPRDNRGNTPLHIACIEGYNPIVTHLLDPVRYEETLDNLNDITYQKIPQDLEARNYDGQTCLHLAAGKTFLSVIRILLGKGANINAQDGKSGRTILHYAAETGNRILLKQLLEYPTLNLDAETYSGATALVLAQGRGYTDIVNILKECGAVYDSSEEESSEEEMNEMMYDDFRINGEPVSFT